VPISGIQSLGFDLANVYKFKVYFRLFPSEKDAPPLMPVEQVTNTISASWEFATLFDLTRRAYKLPLPSSFKSNLGKQATHPRHEIRLWC
jgi:hypothetical protein